MVRRRKSRKVRYKTRYIRSKARRKPDTMGMMFKEGLGAVSFLAVEPTLNQLTSKVSGGNSTVDDVIKVAGGAWLKRKRGIIGGVGKAAYWAGLLRVSDTLSSKLNVGGLFHGNSTAQGNSSNVFE